MAVKYEYLAHLIDRQYEAEQAMLAELEAGNYTYDNPLVKYNLYFINPLSAVVCFKTEEETAVTLTVHGKTPEANLTHTFEKNTVHVLPVVGLYSDYSTKVEIQLYRGKSATITIDTPDVFNGKKNILSMDTTPEYLQDNMIFISPTGKDLSVAYDYAGDARWNLNIPVVFDLKRSKNGNFLIGTDRLLRQQYYMSGLYEMSPCGKIYKEYRIPGGYHHDQWEMEDGNLLILTEDLASETVEDMVVLVDRKTGEILKTWDYKNVLNPHKVGKSGSWTEEDWFHNNAVWYDKNTNSLTLSGRHCDAMINLNYETGDLNWIIGDPEGWDPEYVEKYFFTPVGNNFEWQYEQHACLITPNGDVMCFDNHHYGSKNPDTYVSAKNSFSRAVRYKIDTKERTIEQVWQYGKDRGAEFYSPYICNVEFYNEGHYMVHSGGIGYLNGEPSEMLGAIAERQGGVTYTSTVEICNDKKMLEMKSRGNYYRAEKMKLYSADGNNLTLGKGEILGQMGITKEFETGIPMDPCGELLPDKCDASIVEEVDRFAFRATFEKGQLVMLLLENEEETHNYYISTSANQFTAMCVGTFMESDERKTSTFVNKLGLHGTFDVRVIVDDKKYDTGIQITCE